MDEKTLKTYLKAGEIARKALHLGLTKIKPGQSVAKILDEVEKYIHEQGAIPAFPAQISINEVAAHSCPINNDEKIQENQLVKLDVGVCLNGYIADNARTKSTGANKKLIEASDAALEEALKLATPGTKIGEIGKTIQKTIQSFGFTPIRNLTGHGLGYYNVHVKPTIHNTDTNNQTQLEENMVIAIEPFATNGAGIVYEKNKATLYSLTNPKPVRSTITRKVLKEIKNYKGLPFTTRWLINKFGQGRTNFAIRELRQKEMVTEHPPLLDREKGLVSQSEHTVIVREKPIITTKKQQ